jgi:hypothetical protein
MSKTATDYMNFILVEKHQMKIGLGHTMSMYLKSKLTVMPKPTTQSRLKHFTMTVLTAIARALPPNAAQQTGVDPCSEPEKCTSTTL